jgi:hypothetical protein
VSSTAEAANPRTRTASWSHATRSLFLALAFVVAVAAVRLGMEVVLAAGKGEMRDFASYDTAAVVAASGATFYDPQRGTAWFFENENQPLLATAHRLGTLGGADVTAADVVRTPPTPAGRARVAHQALFLLLNALVLVGIAWILRRLWRETLAVEAVACAS